MGIYLRFCGIQAVRHNSTGFLRLQAPELPETLEDDVQLDERPERAREESSVISVRTLNERPMTHRDLQVRFRRHALLGWLHLHTLATALAGRQRVPYALTGAEAAGVAHTLYGNAGPEALKGDVAALNAWLSARSRPGRHPAGPGLQLDLRRPDGSYRFRGRSLGVAAYLQVLSLTPGTLHSDLEALLLPTGPEQTVLAQLLNLRPTRPSWEQEAVTPGLWFHEQGNQRFQLRLPFGAFDVDSPYRRALVPTGAVRVIIRTLVQRTLAAYAAALQVQSASGPSALGAPCAWLTASVALACEFAPHLADTDVLAALRLPLSQARLDALLDLRSQLGSVLDHFDAALNAASFGHSTRGAQQERFEEWRRDLIAVRARAAAGPEQRRERDHWHRELRALLRTLLDLIQQKSAPVRASTPSEKLLIRREISYRFYPEQGQFYAVLEQRKHYVVRGRDEPLARSMTRLRPTSTSGEIELEHPPRLLPLQGFGLPRGTVVTVSVVPWDQGDSVRIIDFEPPVPGLAAYTLEWSGQHHRMQREQDDPGWPTHGLELESVNSEADIQRLDLQLSFPAWYPLSLPSLALGLTSHAVVFRQGVAHERHAIDARLTRLAAATHSERLDPGPGGQLQRTFELSLTRPEPGRYGFAWRKPTDQEVWAAYHGLSSEVENG